MQTPAIFTPYTIRSVTLRNRLWVSPMCEYSVDDQSGVPNDWHLVHLGSFARGGAGLVMTEATGVVANGRITPQDVGIYTDEQRDAWARIVTFIHARGAAAGIQLAHAGRKASTYPPFATGTGSVPASEGGWPTVAPSAIAFDSCEVPTELDAAGIAAVVADFSSAARRAIDAGFDVLEVHAAHGYLLHQFLSPLSNVRGDLYGGSLENRARLLLEVVAAVRAEAGESVPLFVRFSATDWEDGGLDKEQIATVAGWAAEAGADFFDISTGGLVPGTAIPVGPGYQVPFADFIKHESSVEVGAVGLITEARQAEEIVSSGRADAVILGRAIMRDPHFPLRAAHELGFELDYWPKQYLRAKWERTRAN
jgi:2,4-dienoyl-CoA reductase-like NADH-dependent reductase (Old Yellow Enzyme family)